MSYEVGYMFICVILQAVDPAIPDSITELFFLPVQDVLDTKNSDKDLKLSVFQIVTLSDCNRKYDVEPLADMGSAHRQMHCEGSISQCDLV